MVTQMLLSEDMLLFFQRNKTGVYSRWCCHSRLHGTAAVLARSLAWRSFECAAGVGRKFSPTRGWRDMLWFWWVPCKMLLALSPRVRPLNPTSLVASLHVHLSSHPYHKQQLQCTVMCLQVGWNDEKKYWLVRNSFGSGFADGGYFRVRLLLQPCAQPQQLRLWGEVGSTDSMLCPAGRVWRGWHRP